METNLLCFNNIYTFPKPKSSSYSSFLCFFNVYHNLNPKPSPYSNSKTVIVVRFYYKWHNIDVCIPR